MASGQLGSTVSIASTIGDENLNSIFQCASKKAPTIPTLLKQPLEEADSNTQGPTPERTPSPQSENMAKLNAKKNARATTAMLLMNNTSNCSSDLLPYLQYRARQKRKRVVDKESIWDEELEKAFMDAIHEIPIIGRQKYPNAEGRPCGRNELIAEYIFKATGKRRCRKQVSSHIQVLKKLLKDNGEFMSLVSSELKPSWKTESSSWNNTPNRSTSCKTASPTSEHQSSSYSFSGFPTESESCYSNAFPILYSQANKPRVCELIPVRFGIWAKFKQDCAVGEPWSVGHHTYTELPEDNTPCKPIPLSDLSNWESKFPYLQKALSDGIASTAIIHLRCSLALMTSFPIETSMLGSILEINHVDAVPNTKWECVTRVYAPGNEVWRLLEEVFQNDSTTKLRLPFASKFWAAFFTGLNSSSRSNNCQEPSTTHHSRLDKESRAAIAGITVIQELFATVTADYTNRVRKAIILTDFTKAEQNQPGIAQWRQILPPAPTAPPSMSLPTPLSLIVSPTEVMTYQESFGTLPIMNNMGVPHDQYLFTSNSPSYFVPAIDDSASYGATCSPSFEDIHHGLPSVPLQLRDNYFQAFITVDTQPNPQESSQSTVPDDKNYDPAFSANLVNCPVADVYSTGAWVTEEDVPILHPTCRGG